MLQIYNYFLNYATNYCIFLYFNLRKACKQLYCRVYFAYDMVKTLKMNSRCKSYSF